MRTSRRSLLQGLGALPLAWLVSAKADEAPAFVSDPAPRFDELQKQGRLAGLHGVVAMRGGRIVFERYLTGADEDWGRPLGEVAFAADTPHDLRSVTKSIVGLLYGIALAAGKVPAVDQPLLTQFPEYTDLAADPRRARLKIRDALTMTLGLEWNEHLPYTNPANSETAMELAKDRYRFVLDRPILGEPGRAWMYSGGAVALIGRIIEKGTGRSLPEFAEAALFGPLGVGPLEWAKGADGEASAASGLRLTPRQLAQIGQLILANGRWNGQTIVPSDWLTQSFEPAATVELGWAGAATQYGYLWYLGELPLTGKAGTYGERFIAANGNGGQRLFVIPRLDFVLAMTAGNYDRPGQGQTPGALLFGVFAPSLAV
jgi:CubicO group peptidase (beta-lactamase class C family)